MRTNPVLDVDSLAISGMQWNSGLLWLACAAHSIVATFDPARGICRQHLFYPAVEHACPDRDGVWLQTKGGNLGRQLVLWSPDEERARRFNCPDGAASGMTLVQGKLWLSHRRNRKLFCMDPENGELLWTIRTEGQIFALTEHGGKLWGIECDPGPLGDWSDGTQAVYCFVRFDLVHERVVERYTVPFVPTCLALNRDQFWYGLEGRTGLSSLPIESLSNTHRVC